MASLLNVLVCAALVLLPYVCLGLPLAARLAPRPLALMLAPALGWAVHSAVALPLFFAIGMSRLTVAAAFLAPVIAALAALRASGWRQSKDGLLGRPVLAALFGAALLAWAIAAAVLPKTSADGVALAAPIFDHAKIALVDEMARLGVPPANPFYGGAGPARLSYYYLWHFSAAELAVLAGVTGWEADAALTWFTAFASLAAMIGFAIWLSGRAWSGVWVVVLAATASLRPPLYALFGVDRTEAVTGWQSGFAGWLFQTSWAPQHTASAVCAVLAIFILVELTQRPRLLTLLTFALTMAACFESSTWIGGIVFPLAAAPVTMLLVENAKAQHWRIILYVAAAALIALLLIAPFLYDQFVMSVLRGDGTPVAVAPYDVLVGSTGSTIGWLANLPAYWLIFLLVEFPAFYLTGVVTLFLLLRDRSLAAERKTVLSAFAVLLIVSLGVAWLLVSTFGDNNDLGWRAVLPAVLLLIAFAAVGLSRLMQQPKSPFAIATVVLILLGVPDAAMIVYGNVVVAPDASAKIFAGTPALWQAVRRHAAPAERVANNPFFLEHLTPWSANISWALLANRNSCYANAALVNPTAPLLRLRRDLIEAQFTRVFAGQGDTDDVADLATRYRCTVAVLTPQDGAWSRDVFAASPYYRLVEGNASWRIYKLITLARR